MSERQVGHTTVRGTFGTPIGIRFLRHEIGDHPKYLEISTVFLEGAHMEDHLKICEPEHGYETMVFLEGVTFFSLHTKQYESRKEAEHGHRSIVQQIINGELPLAIPLIYFAGAEMEKPATPIPVEKRKTR